MEINLTFSGLFKNFSEISENGIYIDLHNDFDCTSINYSESDLTLLFKSLDFYKTQITSVEINFRNCRFEKFSFTNGEEVKTIDNMYRGRFVIQNESLLEVSHDGSYYYYIDFLGDVSFELFAKKVICIINLNRPEIS